MQKDETLEKINKLKKVKFIVEMYIADDLIGSEYARYSLMSVSGVKKVEEIK